MKKKVHRAGFTLIEIMITIAIIAILSAVSLSMYQRHVRSARCTAAAVAAQDTLTTLVEERAELGTLATPNSAYVHDPTINGTTMNYDASVSVMWATAGTVITVSAQRTDFVCPNGPTGVYQITSNAPNGVWN